MHPQYSQRVRPQHALDLSVVEPHLGQRGHQIGELGHAAQIGRRDDEAVVISSERSALDSTDRFVAPSRWAAGQLAKLGVPADRLDVLTHFVPADDLAGGSRAHKGRYVLAAGRLSPEKGLDLAIEAAAQANVPLWIAGDGPIAAELTELVDRLKAPVQLLGSVPRAEMPALLRGAAALVLSSRSHEFSPFSVLEAMGSGVPVVATRSGGVPELVGEEHCVPLGDASALAERLGALWSDPWRRREEGEQLLARALEHHSEQRYLSDLLAIYARVSV